MRDDGTPYYVGKGTGDRAYVNRDHGVHKPPSKENIIIQEQQYEADAFEAEKFLISYYGRLDLKTGILRNLTDGGEDPPNHKGFTRSEETRHKMSLAKKGITTTTPEQRLRLKTYNATNIVSETTKEKHRQNMKGNKHSLNHRHSITTKIKMSIAHKLQWAIKREQKCV